MASPCHSGAHSTVTRTTTIPSQDYISLEELQSAPASLKTRKAPGPDELPNELLLWLDDHSEQELLQITQHTWEEGAIPDEWKHALLVSIYKGKGDNSDPANYRPIALLNTMYKLFASIVITAQTCQPDGPQLTPNAVGFRAKRGTKHPLFILRRTMEYANMTGKPLHLLFLDWKQAFGSVDHTALKIALQRLGVAENIQDIVDSIYIYIYRPHL